MSDMYCIQCGAAIDRTRGEHRILGGDMRGITPEAAGRTAYAANLLFSPNGFDVNIHPLTPESAEAAMGRWNPSDEGLAVLRLEAYVCSPWCKSVAYPKWEAAWPDLRRSALRLTERVS